MLALSCALATVAIVGLFFKPTQTVAILSMGALVLLYPLMLVVILALGGVALYIHRRH